MSYNIMESNPSVEFSQKPRKLPIIALATTVWNGQWMNRQQILSRLAQRGWPIIYSNGVLSVTQRQSEDFKNAPWLGSVETLNGVTVVNANKLPARWPRYPRWDRHVLRRHARRLKALRPNLDFSNLICYVFNSDYWPYVEHLGPKYLVYHVYDQFELMGEPSYSLERDQLELARRADLRIASFHGMVSSLPDDIRKSFRELPNAADGLRFAAADGFPCPEDLAIIPRPRIGYVGSINPKVHFNLVLQIARERPDWHWVFVGASHLENRARTGLFEQSSRVWHECLRLSNVHHLGYRRTEDIPVYVKHMDVNVLCYRTDEGGWWRTISPLKLHEQLAVGKPVISSPVEAVLPFRKVVAFADDASEWIKALSEAIDGRGAGTPVERRVVALQNSWNRRVDVLENWLQDMIESRPYPMDYKATDQQSTSPCLL